MKASLKLPRIQAVLGIFEGSGSIRGYGKDETREALPCAFVFLKLSHDLCAETTNVVSGMGIRGSFSSDFTSDDLYRHYRFLCAKTTVK